MKYFLVISLFVSSVSVYARTIEVKLINRFYTSEVLGHMIKFKSHDMDLSMVRSSCNERIFDQTVGYIEELERHLKRSTVPKTREDSFVKIDGKTSYLDPASAVAGSYRDLPNYFIQSKVKEKLLCQKKK